MKTAFLPLVLLAAAGSVSCTKHVHTHTDTTVWQKSTPARSSSAPSRAAAPAASVQPYVEESVTAIQAE